MAVDSLFAWVVVSGDATDRRRIHCVSLTPHGAKEIADGLRELGLADAVAVCVSLADDLESYMSDVAQDGERL